MFDIPTSEPFEGETLMADGWKYFDLPLARKEDWDELLGALGENNFRILAMTQRRFADSSDLFQRGQLLVSPEAPEILKQYLVKKNQNKTDFPPGVVS